MDETAVVHQAIWDQIPELRDPLVQFEREEVESDLEQGLEPFIGPYALITDVFVQPHFLPLVNKPEGDAMALARCARAIEQILEAHSDLLNGAVSIRIISHLLREPERWLRFRQFAGPLLKGFVKSDAQYYAWPFDGPVVE